MSKELLEGSVTGGLSVLNNLLKLIHQARETGNTDPSMAVLVEKLPGEAFAIASELAKQLRELKQNLIENEVDLSLSLDELESSYRWWQHQIDRVPRKANAQIEGLKNALVVLVDDFVAVARCAGMGDNVAGSYAIALEQKREIRNLANTSQPVGQLLDNLIQYVESIAAQFGDM